jgi:hypothetical protein
MEDTGNWVLNIGVWTIYLAFIIGGFIWIGIRIQKFIRSQSQSESNWDRLLNDEEFKQYLSKLKEESSKSPGRGTNGTQGEGAPGRRAGNS